MAELWPYAPAASWLSFYEVGLQQSRFTTLCPSRHVFPPFFAQTSTPPFPPSDPAGEGVPSDQVMQALVDNMARLAVGGSPAPFSMSRQYLAQDELYGLEGRPMGTGGRAPPGPDAAGAAAGLSGGAGVSDEGGAHALGPMEGHHHGPQWLLLKFEKPVTAPRVSAG